jgi:hypothetical protein
LTNPLEIHETRRLNLLSRLTEKGARTQLALRLGTNQAHITHLLKPPTAASHRAIREETARQIEDVMGWSMGALDTREGEERLVPMPEGIEHTERRAAPPVDPELLEESVRTVISVASETHSNLLAEKAAGLVRIVYEHSRSTGKVDPAFVAQLVKLMR